VGGVPPGEDETHHFPLNSALLDGEFDSPPSPPEIIMVSL